MRIAEEVDVWMDPDPDKVDLNASLGVSIMLSFSPRQRGGPSARGAENVAVGSQGASRTF